MESGVRVGVVRVGVIGAGGRLGAVACAAVDAAPDLELTGAVQPSEAGTDLGDLVGVGVGIEVAGSLDALEGLVDVVIEVTRPPYGAQHAARLLELGIHAVVGTSGVTSEELAELAERADDSDANVLVVPNFALGAVLLQRFAEQAARHLPHAEVVELHHDGKADAPSGTAVATADRIADARNETPTVVGGDDEHPGARGWSHRDVPIHSVRLPGLVAHQEVLFGGRGELLTLRHDSLSRDSFAAGILLAVRGVGDLPGLTVGLDALLD
jgi:4-hydroxy-tetrahydrodipicolinate reductase